jgi:hypothetical protein
VFADESEGSAAMLTSTRFASCLLFAAVLVGCDTSSERSSPPSRVEDPDYKVETVLSDGTKIRGTSGVLIAVKEGSSGQDGQAQITLEGEETSASAGLVAKVAASALLETSWTSERVPQGPPTFSLTVHRGDSETNAESGVITFSRDGKTISGNAEVEPQAVSFTFTGTCTTMTCGKIDPDDAEQRVPDPRFESEFCQQFADFAHECN